MLDILDTIFGLKHTGFAIDFLIDVPAERHELLFQLTKRQLHVVHTSNLIICQRSVSALPLLSPSALSNIPSQYSDQLQAPLSRHRDLYITLVMILR